MTGTENRSSPADRAPMPGRPAGKAGQDVCRGFARNDILAVNRRQTGQRKGNSFMAGVVLREAIFWRSYPENTESRNGTSRLLNLMNNSG